LSFAERVPVKLARLPDGDYRPWDEITEWAGEIAEALQQLDPVSGGR
jgi:hypothetical protein